MVLRFGKKLKILEIKKNIFEYNFIKAISLYRPTDLGDIGWQILIFCRVPLYQWLPLPLAKIAALNMFCVLSSHKECYHLKVCLNYTKKTY